MEITRRDLIKMAGIVAAGAAIGKFENVAEAAKPSIKLSQAPVVGSKNVTGTNYTGSAAKVYFTKKIDAESLIKIYQCVNGEVFGKIGIKLHTGEKNGPNILPRDMVQKFQAQVPNSSIIETNTLYFGDRYTTEGHLETLKVNGWTFCPVDIMDADGYVNFPVSGGKYLKEIAMGKNLANYDSIIVLTHFKGHAMGGFGGSLKNIAIGMASGQLGKVQVHGYKNPEMPPPGPAWFDGTFPLKDELMERMAESGKATCDHFGKRIVFLNVMRRLSVDCDCAGTSAAEPTMKDVGILASTDILAIDQACCDFVWSAHDSGDLKERILSRNGLHQLQAMRNLNMGNTQYELISVD
ncbi:MAG: DUF362 domain-containing protein [Selenomonadaceae bacterium]|nr:DUF362 domain-containing protein [Selenomonadaceae bacterium]